MKHAHKKLSLRLE